MKWKIASSAFVASVIAFHGYGQCPNSAPEWSSIKSPELRSAAAQTNVDGLVQSAGGAQAALRQVQMDLPKMQADLAQAQASYRQVSTGSGSAINCSGQNLGMAGALYCSVQLYQDRVTFYQGLGRLLECRARAAGGSVPSMSTTKGMPSLPATSSMPGVEPSMARGFKQGLSEAERDQDSQLSSDMRKVRSEWKPPQSYAAGSTGELPQIPGSELDGHTFADQMSDLESSMDADEEKKQKALDEARKKDEPADAEASKQACADLERVRAAERKIEAALADQVQIRDEGVDDAGMGLFTAYAWVAKGMSDIVMEVVGEFTPQTKAIKKMYDGATTIAGTVTDNIVNSKTNGERAADSTKVADAATKMVDADSKLATLKAVGTPGEDPKHLTGAVAPGMDAISQFEKGNYTAAAASGAKSVAKGLDYKGAGASSAAIDAVSDAIKTVDKTAKAASPEKSKGNEIFDAVSAGVNTVSGVAKVVEKTAGTEAVQKAAGAFAKDLVPAANIISASGEVSRGLTEYAEGKQDIEDINRRGTLYIDRARGYLARLHQKEEELSKACRGTGTMLLPTP
jgi:hypothetical protein